MGRRSELLDRWRRIQEELEDDDPSPVKHQRIRRAKEQWFTDSFQFLVDLPTDDHIWCGYSDIMGPLLETFHSYFDDKRIGSPLKLIWNRISQELGECTQCICQHHQAQETYNADYESDTIDPLLKVLCCLDEERVTDHLKAINGRLRQKEYDPECHSAEVVSVMFEVLMFPTLLDDQCLVNEFQFFIEEIEKSHDLNLAGSQQYPGVYGLLFFKSGRARAIGLRLASYMGKLRRATDLEPLQPLLRKYIGFLEMEVAPATMDTSRPRVKLERANVWLGIKTLLGFLEAPAFEDGIVEKYPNFLSIILNHVSDDTLESSYAITCLRMSFELLGCKLWWRTTLSPSVMRNTLLGQCFHTRNEKSHKDIFDLFLPFLQSLEALQDGEHEKQRRHFLYFLLHQVTQSSNFSVLTRKNARKIAFLIIHRGYKINPPCPPFECGHMWGPSLVNSLKDSSLHISLRQPAFDLMETILISDVSAMIASKLKLHTASNIELKISCLNIDDEDEINLFYDDEEKSCWSEFNIQNKLVSRDCIGWTCIPMLWFDALVEVGPPMLPMSFSKAVFWALSHISLVQPNSNTDLSLSTREWLSLYAGEISSCFGWESPNGSDDGGDGKESRNSVKVSSAFSTLIQTFKRFSANFITEMEKYALHKQWTWESKMAESLVILLADHDHAVRQVDKVMLEHLSKARDLTSQLKFLCSSASSLSAMFSGLRYALKQVQADSISANFHNFQHLFFVVNKLLSDVVKSPPSIIPIEDTNSMKLSSEGGFLRQPCIDSPTTACDHSTTIVDMVSWEKFSYFLAYIMWPFMLKCLAEGRGLIESKGHQMTFVRLLDMLPFVFERLSLSSYKPSQSSKPVVSGLFDFNWLSYLVDLGNSPLVVINRRWKQCMRALLNTFKSSCSGSSQRTISIIEAIISCDTIVVENLKSEVRHLINSLSGEASPVVEGKSMKPKPSISEPVFIKKSSTSSTTFHFDKDSPPESIKPMHSPGDQKVIVLSDDESVSRASPGLFSSPNNSNHSLLEKLSPQSGKGLLPGRPREHSSTHLSEDILKPFSSRIFVDESTDSYQGRENDVLDNSRLPHPEACKGMLPGGSRVSISNVSKDILEPFPSGIFMDDSPNSSQEQGDVVFDNNRLPLEALSSVGRSTSLVHSKGTGRERRIDSLKKTSDIDKSSKDASSFCKGSSGQMFNRQSDRSFSSATSKNVLALQNEEALIKDLVSDDMDDPLERALDSFKRPQALLMKPICTVPKRKVIQLQMPINNKYGLNRTGTGFRRLKPPKLDDWYRPILELDYFSVVGLSSTKDNKSTSLTGLKQVPLCFKSVEHYVEIFRPLVLEEFKAQLHNSYIETSSDDICCGHLSVLSVERIDDFHLVRGRPEDGESIASKGCLENDLVLLTREPLQNSTQDVHILGKVEKREKSSKSRSTILVIRFYFPSDSLRLNKVRRLLIERSKWYLNRIMSIIPQIREFQALSSLHDIPMLPIILNPVERSLGCDEYRKVELSKLSKPLQNMLKLSFNESQLKAISVAIGAQTSRRNFELCLIQGPPGTGKTRTIIAIVSALLSLYSGHENCSSKILNTSSKTTALCTNPRLQISQSAAIAKAWQDAAISRQMIKDDERESGQAARTSRGRVLICAQSNAAVDELVSRISEGLYGSDGKMYKPYLVRVGNAKTVHPSSLPFFIDRLVDLRLADDYANGSDPKIDANAESSSSLRSRLEKLVDSIRYYESRRVKLDCDNMKTETNLDGGVPNGDDVKEISDAALGAKLNILYGQKKALCAELSAAQTREKKASDESWTIKNKIRKSILLEAEIVVTTLSGCGGDLFGVCSESASIGKFGRFSEQCLFDVVVIDEAAQALEPASLIPLQLLKSNGTRCIMVGDPKQLPATVLSNVASKFLYECSMFERLQRAGHPVIMLTEQYRMHPEICRFPSLHFYENKLLNGVQMANKSAPFHENTCLGPYMFFDIVDGHENHGKNSATLSLYNEREVEAAIGLLKLLRSRYQPEFASDRIGIITPYRSQLSLLRSRFSSAFGAHTVAEMEFNTVDGFQGREVDILILSTVRASKIDSSTIGFVADVRRMNVALTRAKLSLWIVGNARTLERNLHWAALLQNAKERKLFLSVSRPYDAVFEKATTPEKLSSSSNCCWPQVGSVTDTTGGVPHKGNSGKGINKKIATNITNGKVHAHSKVSQNSRTGDIPSTGFPPRNTKDLELITRGKHSPSREDGSNKSRKQKDRSENDGKNKTSEEDPKLRKHGYKFALWGQLKTDSSTEDFIKKAKVAQSFSIHDKSSKLSQHSSSTASSTDGAHRSRGEASIKRTKDVHRSSKHDPSHIFSAVASCAERSHSIVGEALTENAKEGLKSSEHSASGKLSRQGSSLASFPSQGPIAEPNDCRPANVEKTSSNCEGKSKGKRRFSEHKVSHRLSQNPSTVYSTKNAKEGLKSSEHSASGKLSRQGSSLTSCPSQGRIAEPDDCGPSNVEKTSSNCEGKPKGKRRFSEHKVSHRLSQNPSIVSSSVEGEMLKGKSDCQPCNVGAPKDLMVTRKRQRDDVDALLSSALIASKKPGVSRPGPSKGPVGSSSTRTSDR